MLNKQAFLGSDNLKTITVKSMGGEVEIRKLTAKNRLDLIGAIAERTGVGIEQVAAMSENLLNIQHISYFLPEVISWGLNDPQFTPEEIEGWPSDKIQVQFELFMAILEHSGFDMTGEGVPKVE